MEPHVTDDKLFDGFEGVVRNIRTTLYLWESMFGRDVEVDDIEAWPRIMKQSAPHFFSYAQRWMLVGIMLEMAKLTDSDQTFGKKNLTITRIYSALDFETDPDMKPWIDRRFASVREKLNNEQFREFRHKVLAHNDVEIFTGTRECDVQVRPVLDAAHALVDFAERVRWFRAGRRIDVESGDGISPRDGLQEQVAKEVQHLLRCLRCAEKTVDESA